MTNLHVACIQMRSNDVPAENIAAAVDLMVRAKKDGAAFIATPEMTSLMDNRPGALQRNARPEADDEALRRFSAVAKDLAVWLLIGSLPIRVTADKCANRCFLLAPDGSVRARYDKIHMFDVDVGDGQSYRESRSYQAGDRAVVASMAGGVCLGLSICFDLRFPHLYRALAKAGAEVLCVPAAFTRVTGEAHWHVLLRARAIENGAFVVAPAQGGRHADGRETFGHSLIVGPWGDVLAEGGVDPGVVSAVLDLSQVAAARSRIPSLRQDQPFTLC